jgi:hypothetical protein
MYRRVLRQTKLKHLSYIFKNLVDNYLEIIWYINLDNIHYTKKIINLQ